MMTRGFSIGPVGTHKPMASMGSQGQFYPQHRKYATTMPAMSASYKGAGHGTMKPMLSASQKFAVKYKGSKNVGKQQTPALRGTFPAAAPRAKPRHPMAQQRCAPPAGRQGQ